MVRQFIEGNAQGPLGASERGAAAPLKPGVAYARQDQRTAGRDHHHLFPGDSGRGDSVAQEHRPVPGRGQLFRRFRQGRGHAATAIGSRCGASAWARSSAWRCIEGSVRVEIPLEEARGPARGCERGSREKGIVGEIVLEIDPGHGEPGSGRPCFYRQDHPAPSPT